MRPFLATVAGMVVATGLVLATGCAGTEERPREIQPDPSVAMPRPNPALAAHTPKLEGFRGSVIETMDAAGYTYVRVDTGDERLWAAAPEFSVMVGAEVDVPAGLFMVDFYSKSLQRKFDVIYFVAGVEVTGAETASEGGAARSRVDAGPALDFSDLRKPEGGHTVAELLAGKAALAGKKVTVRAKVVKFTPKVMGTNWLHVRDGTGPEGANDLTLTSSSKAKVGDTVLASGVLGLDKDFGFGYRYAVIIEDARIVVEPPPPAEK